MHSLYRNVLIYTGFSLGLILLLLIFSSILNVGRYLGDWHPSAEIVFYLLAAMLFGMLFIYPIASVWLTPPIPVHQLMEADKTCRKNNPRQLKRISRKIRSSKTVGADHRTALKTLNNQPEALQEKLVEIFKHRLEAQNEVIHRYAKQVFVSTALSQSGRLDALMVLVINLRMVHAIIQEYGYRPSPGQLLKTYTNVFLAALLAEGIEDIEFAEVFPALGKGVIGAIPGLGMVSSSLLQGTGNAFFTLRVGLITQQFYLQGGDRFNRSQARKQVTGRAIKQLKLIVREGLMIFPKELQRKVKEALSSNKGSQGHASGNRKTSQAETNG